ncbi:MAG TPA: ABC transporter permease, partial [Pirellulales bacterium]
MTFVTLIWKNLYRRKSRSLLTILGIAIAVGTTVSLLGITEGFERTELETFEGRGADVVVTAAGTIDQLNSNLSETYKDKMLQIDGVAKVACALLDFTTVDAEGNSLTMVVQGWAPDSVNFEELKFEEGARFTEPDGKVCMLGRTAADNFGKKVGDTLRVQGEDFKITAVFHSFSV